MDLLYRLFYTVFSMGIITCITVPVVLVLRFLLAKAPKKYIVNLWMLLFFRGICPVSMSSPFCLKRSWNRLFHIILSQAGLDISGETSIMRGWRDVFNNSVSADTSYMVCTIIWCAGITGICLFTLVRQIKLYQVTRSAQNIYGKIYQSDGIDAPLIKGIFSLKQYFPSDMKANDIKYLLQHFEAHDKRKDGVRRFFAFIVVVVQWFNPFIWAAYYFLLADIEMAADEEVKSPTEYAQELFNLKQSSFKGRQSLLTFDEKNIKGRVYRLMHKTPGGRGYACLAGIVFCFCFIWAFLLRPLQVLWNGGTWSNRIEQPEDTTGIASKKDETVVASLETISPNGLERTIELLMTSGTYDAENGYTGDFAIRLSDNYGAVLDTVYLDYVFDDVAKGNLHFDNETVLYAYDYNADGTNELVTGQKAEISRKRWRQISGRRRKRRKKILLNEYHMWNIEETSLKEISDAIYDTSDKDYASCQFDIPEQTTRLFISELAGKNIYYVWNIEEEKYQQRKLSKEDIKKYMAGYTGPESTEGEKNTHTLQSGSDIFAEVVTRRDSTGNEVIKQIILKPGSFSKKMKVMDGYFCDIQWVMAADGVNDRYAVLIYNGLKAQTFTVYDLEEQKVYYAHEDGNSVLGTVFKSYNGSDIEFNEGSPAVYSLLEKDGNKLKIGFAASTKDGKTVNGSYIYDTTSGNISNFSYTQNISAD